MHWVTKYRRHLIVATAITIYVGCSDVKFEGVPSTQCVNVEDEFGNGSCFDQAGTLNYHFEFKVGRIDILFVDDNSGSMYTEQSQMATKFESLWKYVAGLDYQMAIVTTDISSSPGNIVRGEGQDGKFLQFPNGDRIISSSTSDIVYQFQKTIMRPETLTCDSNGGSGGSCPSGDERGIYALNMALDREENSSFFRKDSHLAVVILSDEDERSNGGNISGYPLQNYDLPLTFAQKVHSQLGAGKTVSVHAVVIRPGDSTCYNIQNSQPNNVKGYYGTQYARLVNADTDTELRSAHAGFLSGELGSICANDYGVQMGDIGRLAAVNANTKVLPCVPDADKISVNFSPAQSKQIDFSVNSDGLLTFNPQPDPGTTVSVDVTCPK